MTKRAARRKGSPRDGAKLIDILTCVQCGKVYERRLWRNYSFPRKYCDESCRAKAWREAGHKPCKPPAPEPELPKPVVVVEHRPKRDSVYRRVHEKACVFAGLTKRESEGYDIDGDT